MRRGRRLATLAVLTALVALGTAAPPSPSSAAATAPWAPATPYASPVEPMRIVALARLPARPWLPGHRGVDLDAPVGAPVSVPAPGVVAFVGRVVDRGVVTVLHDDGARSSMEPVTAGVQVGDRVATGDVIGAVSADPGHCAPAACLHWGVRAHGDYVDPLDMLAGYGPVRLLPRAQGAFRRRRRCAAGTRAAS